MNIAGIILAAGEGSRMGGAVKQMLPFRSKTILECVIETAMASSISRVFVVIGHCADVIEPALADKDVTVVINRDYRGGQSHSLKAGIAALSEDIDAALFLLGDQPLVSTVTINLILDAFAASRPPVVIPVVDGKRGNPVLFGRETFEKLLALTDDYGGRALFAQYADRALELPVNDRHIHFDLDTLADYHRLLEIDAMSEPEL